MSIHLVAALGSEISVKYSATERLYYLMVNGQVSQLTKDEARSIAKALTEH